MSAFLEASLKGWNYAIDNPTEAVKAFEENNYDIVFMDIQMPEMDGYGACKKIRSSNKKNNTLPIIAMTANAMKGDREKCLAAGMDDYIPKPIDPDMLYKAIGTWLD